MAERRCIVVVTGGRDYKDNATVGEVLDEVAPTAVVHGGAPGTDTLCAQWARAHGVTSRTYPAPRQTHGNSAGPVRNQAMLDCERPDLLVAFPGGKDTADMMRRAQNAGIPIRRVYPRFGATIGARMKARATP